ncbi:MAG: hypothetical protein IPM20_03020 [Gammaproteobacteria bacterium]|nr:hypothetical protein [Gammaproteobacteria bacterium]
MPKSSGNDKTQPVPAAQGSLGAPAHAVDMESYLARLEEAFDAGHSEALYPALNACLALDHPVPDWVKKGFAKAYNAWSCGEAETLDTALGIKRPHLKVVRKEQYAGMIYLRVQELHRQGKKIDDDLFATVAAEFTVWAPDQFKSTKVKELYAAQRDEIAAARKTPPR